MYISKLKIRNFKNLYNNVFTFDKNINTIIGENGTGKTNIFQALRLVLDNDYKFYFGEENFSNKIVNQKGHWIIISIDFEEIGSTVEEMHLKPNENHSGTITFMYRPNKNIRLNLYRLSKELNCDKDVENKKTKTDELISYINNIDYRTDYETIYTVSTIFDFNDNQNYKEKICDFENNIFPDPEIHDDKSIFGNKDMGFSKYINVTFIPAIRNVTTELTSENNFLTRILKKLTDEIKDDDWSVFKTSINNINIDLGQIKQFTDFIANVDSTTYATVGNTYATNVELKMEIPSEKYDLVKYFNLMGREVENSMNLYNRSLGDNNIIYFALKLVESSMQFGHTNKIFKLMLIEEPEAHIHKFLQESLFSGLRAKSDYQLFLSTHSVHISESSKISSMTILDRKNNYIVSYKPDNNLGIKQTEYLERYLDATKSSILFSKIVCIVEGTAELLMIPKLYELLYGINFSSLGISIHSIDSSYMEGISMLFDESRIQKYACIITDGDKDYLKANSEKEINAKKRISKLINLHKKNKYIKVSNSEYTFEIDFFRENMYLLKKFVNDNNIYHRKKILEEFDSKNDIVIYDRIKKLCDLLGKGWFAFRFINWLEKNNQYLKDLKIPDYINKSISFLINNLIDKSQIKDFKTSISKNQNKNCNNIDTFVKSLKVLKI